MTEANSEQSEAGAGALVARLMIGSWSTHIVGTAARLRIADHLAGDPKTAAELATLIKVEQSTLARFLRALVGLGLLIQKSNGRFALTAGCTGEAGRLWAAGHDRAGLRNLKVA